jgi:hypothetical protein
VSARWISLLGSISAELDVDQYFWLYEAEGQEAAGCGCVRDDDLSYPAEAFSARFVVESDEMSLSQIGAAMGRDPDEAADVAPSGPQVAQRGPFRSWSASLAWAVDVHGGTEGLGAALEGLGPDLADRARQLVSRGCTAAVRVTQQLSDHSWTKGIHLETGPVKWMAAAGAELNIEQQVLARQSCR